MRSTIKQSLSVGGIAPAMTTQQIYHLEESLQLSLYLAVTDGTDIHSQPECQWPL